MLTGKDVYEAARPFLEKEGYECLEWETVIIPPDIKECYESMAKTINATHIAPLQGLVRDLYRTVDEVDAWDSLTDGWAESLQKRFKELCGGQS